MRASNKANIITEGCDARDAGVFGHMTLLSNCILVTANGSAAQRRGLERSGGSRPPADAWLGGVLPVHLQSTE